MSLKKIISHFEELNQENFYFHLQEVNSYIREYVFTHMQRPERIVQLKPMLAYLEDRFDDVVREHYEEWSHMKFSERERLYERSINRDDFELFKQKGWLKD